MFRFASFCLATILAIAFVATTVQAEEITNEYVNFQKSGNRDLKKIISYSVFSLS